MILHLMAVASETTLIHSMGLALKVGATGLTTPAIATLSHCTQINFGTKVNLMFQHLRLPTIRLSVLRLLEHI